MGHPGAKNFGENSEGGQKPEKNTNPKEEGRLMQTNAGFATRK
jgi:hypothetical protein